VSSMQDISEALVTLLETGEAAGTFSRSILTVRSWAPLEDLEDLTEISVQAIPVGTVRKRESNGTWLREIRVDVLVRKKTPGSEITDGVVNQDWIDSHVALMEEIDDYLADQDNCDLTDTAVYIEPGDREAESSIKSRLGVEWYPEQLVNNRFFGVVRVAYRVTEA
jgi:hypothetical protein